MGQAFHQGSPVAGDWSVSATLTATGTRTMCFENANTRQTAIWYLNNNVFISGVYGPTLPVGWSLVGVADFNRDGHPDYVLENGTGQTAIWYLSGRTLIGGAYGPTLPSGVGTWQLQPTLTVTATRTICFTNPNTRQTAIWYLNNNVFTSGAYRPNSSSRVELIPRSMCSMGLWL